MSRSTTLWILLETALQQSADGRWRRGGQTPPSPARVRGRLRACLKSSRPGRRRVPSAFRRARTRTPRCRCACRPPVRAPARDSCRPRCRESRPRAFRRPSSSATASDRGRRPSPAIAFARPKSSTFTTPSGVILMLAGFRSRWTMPFSCAASSASAICRAIGQRLRRAAAGPRAMRSASVSPSTSSSTSARDAVGVFEAVDRADVRMIERRQHARLALEPRQPIGIARERGAAGS